LLEEKRMIADRRARAAVFAPPPRHRREASDGASQAPDAPHLGGGRRAAERASGEDVALTGVVEAIRKLRCRLREPRAA
jgi:hypothetical protein